MSRLKGRRGVQRLPRSLSRTLRDWTLSALTDHGADGKAAALAADAMRNSGMLHDSEELSRGKLHRSVILIHSGWLVKEQAEDQTGWCLGNRGDDIGGDSSEIAGRIQAPWRLFASGSFSAACPGAGAWRGMDLMYQHVQYLRYR